MIRRPCRRCSRSIDGDLRSQISDLSSQLRSGFRHFVVLLAALAPVALFTGAAMIILPGAATAGALTERDFNGAWSATRPLVKLAWLVGFAIGTLAGFALMLVLLGPPNV
jgi:hypothetical protein